ncbi:hypothetical protein K4G94_20480, partial [Mycobacterium tuberculosis]|nr:hypothetical protein [Mycobacterium tuberculosis]
INTLLRTLTADLIVIAILTFPYNKRNKNIAKVIMIITTINHMIYHNVALRAPLKRAERDSAANTAKRDVLPGVNRKNASGSLSAHCIAMHESE